MDIIDSTLITQPSSLPPSIITHLSATVVAFCLYPNSQLYCPKELYHIIVVMWESCYPRLCYNFRTACSCLSWGNSMTLGHICETISKPCWLNSRTHGGQVQKQGCYEIRATNKSKNIVAYLVGILLNCHKILVIAILASWSVTPMHWAKFYNNFQCGPQRSDLNYPPLPQLFPPLCSSFLANWTANNWNANSGSWCPVRSPKGAMQSNNNMTEIAQKGGALLGRKSASITGYKSPARSKQLPQTLQLQEEHAKTDQRMVV